MAFDADEQIRGKVKEWLTWDQNEKTRAEIEDMVKNNNVSQLRTRLCSRMEFGTAGLRAAMGAGYSMMNDLTIIQTTQGFAKYMLKSTPTVTQNGVAIGYDARHNSKRFAQLTAAILLNKGIPVYLFSNICPTPFVAYCVLNKHCDWGIMVTASHNPKEDNGYKVYYSNGAQIISPHDKGISSHIESNLEPWKQSWDTSILDSSALLHDPFDDIFSSYMLDLEKLCFFRKDNAATPLRFTYTPMHGVGQPFFAEAFNRFNFASFIPVAEQAEPDPEFSTVKYPNPEEGKSALDLAVKAANANGSTIILANDPDADRLALAEKQPDGRWHIMSGNEIGSALGWWLITRYLQSQTGPASEAYCLASAVSSRLLHAIASKEGVNYIETLTGFKWMGNKSDELLKQGKKVLFAFEEAIGFMCGTTVLDKDGISAAVVVAEMVVHLASQGKTVLDHLRYLNDTYGYHVSKNSYFICHDPVVIKRLFERLRNFGGPEQYPTRCGPFTIKSVRDLTTGFDSSQPDGKALLPSSKSSQMITFTFHNSCIVTMRTSGTEPKIKYYTEFCSRPEMGLHKEEVDAELDKVVEMVIDNFFEPAKNGLIARQT